MASFTLQNATKNFAVGDTVGAYAAENIPLDNTQGPRAAALDTATVSSDGTLAFSGLAPGAAYWAAADVGTNEWRKQNFYIPASEDDAQVAASYGAEWFVDAVSGSDSNGGTAWDDALDTVEAAIDLASGGDTIYLIGKTREENVIVPNTKGGLKIKGVGGRASHADTPWPYASAAWLPPSSPTADTDLLVIRGQGVTVEGILFDCPVDAAGIKLERNALSGNNEFDASHATIRGCRFDSGNTGIEDAGGCFNVLVEDCTFARITDGTGRAIYCSSTAVAAPLNWLIRDCNFKSNDNDIIAAASGWVIRDNTFSTTGTCSIDFTGGVATNVVTRNLLGGTYGSTLYKVAGAGDEWGGNFNVISGGVTAADPA